MAGYRLTFAQLKAEAEHAMSGAPDSRVTTAGIVNAALDYLYGLHTWSWREKITTLATVAANGRISLPSDFQELIALLPNALVGMPARSSPTNVVVARTQLSAVDTAGVLYYVTQAPATAVTAVPLRCLEIAPLPVASTANAFSLVYRTCAQELSGDTDVPALPYGFHGLLRTLVRAFAFSSQAAMAGHDWQLFNAQVPDYIASDTKVGGSNRGGLISTVDMDYMGGAAELSLAEGTSILMPGD